MPEIRTRELFEIRTKSETTKSEPKDTFRILAAQAAKDADISDKTSFQPRIWEPPPIRSKEDILRAESKDAMPEAQAIAQVEQAVAATAYEAARELACFSLETKKSPTPPPQETTGTQAASETPEPTPLKIWGEDAAFDVRTKPENEANIKFAPLIIKTEAYMEEQKLLKFQRQDTTTKRQQQARTSAHKEFIKNTVKRSHKKAAATSKKLVSAVSKTAKASFNAIAGITGLGAILLLFCVVILAGAIAASPMGILFTEETSETSLTEAIATINAEYTAELQAHQAGSYTSIQTAGRSPSRRDVIAVFACKTAWTADGADVMTLDARRLERLSNVFWDMTEISSSVETVQHEDTDPDDNVDDSYTETILTVTTTAKTADDMRTEYNFSKQQNEALDLLLDELEDWGIFLSDLDISDAGALALWDRLPENLSNERRMVVQYALSLVGKVNYFWGGKSLILGWDSRWGTPTVVSAAGSPTTGTTRPYGMDCSGFVDWVFYNVSSGSYVIGKGGGCISQHNNCYAISWSEAQPGDLVFYPNDMHIGIVGGWDANGNIQIIHCASGSLNGVVITGKSGFTSIARPYYYHN